MSPPISTIACLKEKDLFYPPTELFIYILVILYITLQEVC